MKETSKMDFVSFLLFVLCFITLFINSVHSSCSTCLTSGQCRPPDCFCCRGELGLDMRSSEIPQIVFFTFDDALTDKAAEFYNRLFNNSRLNPNGCPISMTMFISHTDTQYNHVTEFHRRGMEIAAHSVTHSHMNQQNFFTEAKNQKQNLAKYGKLPESDIVGWRSPFLEPVGDLQPEQLKQLGYMYDATLTFSKRKLNDTAPTPFTLDFGWPYDCKVKPCPRGRHQGFWEVPVVSLLDYLHRYDCVYVDGCMNIPPNEELAFKFLMDNFNSYYQREKIPFGINMHPSWFYTTSRLNAMDRFIAELVSRPDVFIVSVKKTLDWLKNPTPLSRINSFQPWQCKSSAERFKAPVMNQQFSSMPERSFVPPPPSLFQSFSSRQDFQPRQSQNEVRTSTQQLMEQQRKELRRQNTLARKLAVERQAYNSANEQWTERVRSPHLPGTPLIQTKDIQGPPKIPSTLKPKDDSEILSNAFGQVFWRQKPRENIATNQELPSRRHSKKWGRKNIQSTRQRGPINKAPRFEFHYKIPTDSTRKVQVQQKSNKTIQPSQLDRQLGIRNTVNRHRFNRPSFNNEVRNEVNIGKIGEKPAAVSENKHQPVPKPTSMSIYERMEQQILYEQRLKKQQEQFKLENKRRKSENLNIDKAQQRKLEQQMKLELERKRQNEKEMKNRERDNRNRQEYLQRQRDNRRRRLIELRKKRKNRQPLQRQFSNSGSRIAVSPRRTGESSPRKSGSRASSSGGSETPSRASGRNVVENPIESQWSKLIDLLMG
ncbi:uncharacterized protein LOC110454264 [Mizuhopecten yessoensis]|uniref:Reticulocyte-binding protein 2-like a n=1 Tax=Mizuhopecten yessoensis TaxID=6573 RepID=A0A210QFM2_MIZYE|nr:uncharacterized protein LOC110454264 [Mizuhopecten yessoensis]OWF47544.1 Reticulocyte-binding protein 2-like a [Mizuhopecten yessoensis]